MLSYLKPAVIMFMLMALLTGVAYPLLVTGLAQFSFPDQANGSLVKDEQGNIAGSALIGQAFRSSGYFWGRPSATAPFPYNSGASGGSNLGPVNPAVAENVRARIHALTTADTGTNAHLPVPVDLVTASASGLDPHISPAAAAFQLRRVAASRKLALTEVQRLVAQYTEPRQWGLLGEPRVNVLLLNRALDAMAPVGSKVNVK